MQKLKLNDEVVITAGKDKGKTGKVKKLFSKRNKVLVEGVNLVKKALKPTQENPGGGIATIEAAVDRSNVSLVSPKDKKATRVRIETKDNKKVRVAVRCGSVLD